MKKNQLSLAVLSLVFLLFSCNKEEADSLSPATLGAEKGIGLSATSVITCDIIDFENAATFPRDANGFITGVVSQGGANVKVTGYARASNVPAEEWGTMNRANIFDTSNPGFWDNDLSTPGWGANNTKALQNVLIVQELVGPNNSVGEPNDNAHGGMIVLDFSEIGPVTVNSMNVLDIEEHQEHLSRVDFYDINGNKINAASIPITPTGDNGVGLITFSEMKNVVKMVVTFDGKWNEFTNAGSGGIDNIEFCTEEKIPCGPCEGKVSSLTMKYTGANNASLVAKVKNGAKKETLLTKVLNSGDVFTVEGTLNPDWRGGFAGTLGTELILELTVNGVTTTTMIHTSCSQPIYESYANGMYTTLSGASKYGGALCEFTPTP